MKRHVFFLSDGTGITAKTLGQSLLTQFDHIDFEYTMKPYVDSEEKAHKTLTEIQHAYDTSGLQPIVFATFVNEDIRYIIRNGPCLLMDLLETFIGPLEQALDTKSSHTVGKSHSAFNVGRYNARINAVDYTLSVDDGLRTNQYDKADIILIGVSRCGKTPTCLYMALQFGLFAANYPITDEELESQKLPEVLLSHREKLFGLTIDCERLLAIRNERRPDSQYASPRQCRQEIHAVETILQKAKIPYLDTTHLSIEEISTRILAETGIQRRLN